MSTSTRREMHILSVQRTRKLLTDVCNSPESFLTSKVAGALKSQGALAAYCDSDAGIIGMSLNHQKAICDSVFSDFSELDNLRRAALMALSDWREREKRGNRQTKAGLLKLVKDQEAKLAVLREDLFLLQRAFDLRCQQARAYAESASKAIVALCAKEQREINATLAVRKLPVPASNVAQISRRRNG